MVAPVMMPSVPSDPINRSVKLYPADDFFGPANYEICQKCSGCFCINNKKLKFVIEFIVYDLLLSFPPVFKILPSGKTTSRLRQFSLIVPYRTAFVPLAPVAHIPQIDAFAPGSIGNDNPKRFCLFKVINYC